MIQTVCPVSAVKEVAENIFVITFRSREIGESIKSGQFLNVKTDATCEPLLRRPYSVYRAEEDRIEIVFNVVGKVSSLLRTKRPGDFINVIGPLGVPFSLGGNDFDTAVLVGGGLGIAPLPLATRELLRNKKSILTFLGARTSAQLVEAHLENINVSTDDGSRGHHGNIVELLRQKYSIFKSRRPKIFACGPTKMLNAVAGFAVENDVPCEISMEGPMACGFGVCQGCPVELASAERKYGLMCTDGPTFDVRKIKLPL